jgi:hypothetical protein
MLPAAGMLGRGAGGGVGAAGRGAAGGIGAGLGATGAAMGLGAGGAMGLGAGGAMGLGAGGAVGLGAAGLGMGAAALGLGLAALRGFAFALAFAFLAAGFLPFFATTRFFLRAAAVFFVFFAFLAFAFFDFFVFDFAFFAMIVLPIVSAQTSVRLSVRLKPPLPCRRLRSQALAVRTEVLPRRRTRQFPAAEIAAALLTAAPRGSWRSHDPSSTSPPTPMVSWSPDHLSS